MLQNIYIIKLKIVLLNMKNNNKQNSNLNVRCVHACFGFITLISFTKMDLNIM